MSLFRGAYYNNLIIEFSLVEPWLEVTSTDISYSSKNKINRNFNKLLISREGIIKERDRGVRELSYFRMSKAGASLREKIKHHVRYCFIYLFIYLFHSWPFLDLQREKIMHKMKNCFYFSSVPFWRSFNLSVFGITYVFLSFLCALFFIKGIIISAYFNVW